MVMMASQITSLTVDYSTVYSDADQRKHKSSASLAFVWGIHRDRWFPRTKGQLRGKCFHLMTSSWIKISYHTPNMAMISIMERFVNLIKKPKLGGYRNITHSLSISSETVSKLLDRAPFPWRRYHRSYHSLALSHRHVIIANRAFLHNYASNPRHIGCPCPIPREGSHHLCWQSTWEKRSPSENQKIWVVSGHSPRMSNLKVGSSGCL